MHGVAVWMVTAGPGRRPWDSAKDDAALGMEEAGELRPHFILMKGQHKNWSSPFHTGTFQPLPRCSRVAIRSYKTSGSPPCSPALPPTVLLGVWFPPLSALQNRKASNSLTLCPWKGCTRVTRSNSSLSRRKSPNAPTGGGELFILTLRTHIPSSWWAQSLVTV